MSNKKRSYASKQKRQASAQIDMRYVGGIVAAVVILAGVYLYSGKTASTQYSPTAGNDASVTAQTGAQTSSVSTAEADFNTYCASCHGSQGVGGENGPPLKNKSLNASRVTEVVSKGSSNMISFGSALTGSRLSQLGEYVSKLK